MNSLRNKDRFSRGRLFTVVVVLLMASSTMVFADAPAATIRAIERTYWNELDHEAVVEMATDAIDQYGASATLLAYRASSLRIMDDYRRSEADLQHALRIEPNSAIALSAYARLRLSQDRDREAYELAERAVDLAPTSMPVLYNAGVVAGARDDHPQAIQYYRRAEEHRRSDLPGIHSSTLNRLGLAYWDLAGTQSGLTKFDTLETALEWFTDLIEQYPEDYFGYYNRGRLGVSYTSIQHVRQTRADLDRAVELRPNSAYAYAHRARARRFFTNSYEGQLSDINRAIQLDSDNSYFYALRGWFMRLEGEYSSAINSLNRAIRLNDDYVWAIKQRALVYYETSDVVGFSRDYDRLDDLIGTTESFSEWRDRRIRFGFEVRSSGTHRVQIRRVSGSSEIDSFESMIGGDADSPYRGSVYIRVRAGERVTVRHGSQSRDHFLWGAELVFPGGSKKVVKTTSETTTETTGTFNDDTQDTRTHFYTTRSFSFSERVNRSGHLRVDFYVQGGCLWSDCSQYEEIPIRIEID